MDPSGELRISAELAEQVMAHARAGLPNEACGLLSGPPGGRTATAFHPAANRHRSPLRFDAEPADLVRIMAAIEGAGEALVAVFHSHVAGPAEPSATDVREAFYPEALHLLASMADPSAAAREALRAWRIHDGRATELRLEVI